QRSELASRQGVSNALRVQTKLRSGSGDFGEWFVGLRTESPGGFAAATLSGDQSVSTDTRLSYETFPDELRRAVDVGQSGVQRFSLDDKRFVGVGIHIADVDANYFEAFQLDA